MTHKSARVTASITARRTREMRRRRDAGIFKMSFEYMSRPLMRFGGRIQDLQYVPLSNRATKQS